MTSRSMSPRRRHILSSINPEPVHLQTSVSDQNSEPRADASRVRKSQSHELSDGNAKEDSGAPNGNDDSRDGNTRHAKASKFRFKSKSSSSSSRHHSSRRHRERDYQDEDLESQMDPRYRADYDPEHDARDKEGLNANTDQPATSSRRHRNHDSSRSSRHHHHHRSDRHRDEPREHRDHRHRSRSQERSDGHDPDSSSRRHRHKRRRREHQHSSRDHRTRSPTPPNPHEPPPLDPDAAFRESLFDAMADDEGAAYWEAVYGQPIHVYSRGGTGSNPTDPTGELEQMTDEEYAAHVRQRMWEKTHEGLVDERNRREEAKKRKAAESEQAARLTREMERSLKRGDERRRKRTWREKWDVYTAAWEKWDGSVGGVPWPIDIASRTAATTTGPELDGFVKEKDGEIDTAGVREFFVTALDPHELGEMEYSAKLKSERVRWHPDKMQQRLVGSAEGGKVDEVTMRNVTAVFQVIDRLWSDTRARQMK